MTLANRPVFCLAAVIGMLLALYAAWTGLARLRDARIAVQIAQQNADANHMPVKGFVPQGGAYATRTRDMAAEAFRLRLLEYAIDRGLLVERIEIAPAARDASAAIVARVAVSGAEAQVLQYAATIERSRPLVRLTDWRLQATTAGDGTIRLDGHASTIWEGP